MIPIWTIYTFSIKCHNSYLNTYSISESISRLYSLSIVSLYRPHYRKYI